MTDSEHEILRLIATIRNMDQRIFAMSQCSSWEAMRPIFQSLHEETMRRMNEESDRIRMLMIPEIRRTYLPPMLPQIEKKEIK